MKEKYLYGTPDLVMEILSSSNPSHDRKRKFELYSEAGVHEYWIVDLDARSIEVFTFASGAAVLTHHRSPRVGGTEGWYPAVGIIALWLPQGHRVTKGGRILSWTAS